jgi:hypothetical protein
MPLIEVVTWLFQKVKSPALAGTIVVPTMRWLQKIQTNVQTVVSLNAHTTFVAHVVTMLTVK